MKRHYDTTFRSLSRYYEKKRFDRPSIANILISILSQYIAVLRWTRGRLDVTQTFPRSVTQSIHQIRPYLHWFGL